MKKKMLPLVSDTIFLFFVCSLFFLCVFRFYLRSFWAAAGLGFAAGLAAAALFYAFRRARLRKKYAGLAEKDEIEKFRFHLAASSPENNVRLIAGCLAHKAAQSNTADAAAAPNSAGTPAENGANRVRGTSEEADAAERAYRQATEKTAEQTNAAKPTAAPAAKQTAGKYAAAKTAENTAEPYAADGTDTANGAHGSAKTAENASAPYAADGTAAPKAPRIIGNEIRTENAHTWVLFSFKDADADDLAPALRAEGENKCVYACGFTDEAKKLAAAFGITLKDAGDAHALAKECGRLPEKLLAPPAAAGGLRKKLAFRVRREAWRGYLFSGSFLLVFSLMTVFPVYYIVTGGLLLAAAVLVRLFGKPTHTN